MANPFTNSAAGNALAGALVPGAAKLSKAMAPKTADPAINDLADRLHPVPEGASGPPPSYVTMTPNRVTGKFAK